MKRRGFIGLGLGGLVAWPNLIRAQSTDPLVPRSKPEDARVGPLAMVTIISDDPLATKRFYQGGMDMDARDVTLSGRAASLLASSYGLSGSSDLKLTIFERSNLPAATKVRVIYCGAGLPMARPDHDSEYLGALSLGFPVQGIDARTAMLSAYGHPATAGVTVLNLAKSDGSAYAVKEAHFKGPDGVLSLGIDRGDMQAVGPTDPALAIGGPAYSGMIVSDTRISDVFFADVLGFEKRRDVDLSSSGPNGGLGLPAGTRFQFQQWFAPGAATGYLVVMRYLNAGKPRPHPPGSSMRGIAAYSFYTRKFGETLSKARQARFTVSRPQRAFVDGQMVKQSAHIGGPDGIVFELIEV